MRFSVTQDNLKHPGLHWGGGGGGLVLPGDKSILNDHSYKYLDINNGKQM